MSMIIDDSSVSKFYGGVKANTDISLTVETGGITGLFGPNGSGKSTILHTIFGFKEIRSGSIKIGDGATKRDIGEMSPSSKLKESGIGYILQDKSVFPGMTVEENLWMGKFLKNKPAEAKEAAEKVFEFADLGYVLMSGEVAIADKGDELLEHPDVGRLFLGG